ncbi:hypothetical protein K9M47_00235 [Candidatus Gracilibacteria bacterium]|nr:hypothetical protein [Candidatus Gracilibacteria bacterium]MCF7898709.1 hypothetical protein [Candidatus Paceibacterota bacterium]
MFLSIFSYLSLRYENEEDQKYIEGLIEQFRKAQENGSFHLALFAYHLLFMIFIYQTIYKAKLWKLEQFSLAFTISPADKKKQYTETSTVYAFVEIPERTIFTLLSLFQECENTISKCKKIIDYRNNNLGHATPYIVSEGEFENKIEEYDQVAFEIHKLTHTELANIFDKYFASIDSEVDQTKDDIELNLIVPNRLSDKDLESFASECLIVPDFKKKQASKILKDYFGVSVELA